VTDVDLRGDRQLVLQHKVRDAVPLDESQRKQVLAHVRRLWGYDVRLEGIDAKTGATLYDSVAKAADAAA
jgi:stage V sporulation protein R